MFKRELTRPRAAKRLIAASCVLAAIPFVASTPAAAAGVSVTTETGDGPGSLPWAFEQANNDRSIRQININTDVRLCEPVVYDGQQQLAINGNGNEVYLYNGGCKVSEPVDTRLPDSWVKAKEGLSIGGPGVLNFFTDANIRIRNIDIATGTPDQEIGYPSSGGIYIAMSRGARRAARHNFTNVNIEGVTGFGISANDNESNGSVYITALRVNVSDVDPAFFDMVAGLQDESGFDGDEFFGGLDSGIEILEGGPGVASLNLRNSTIENTFGAGVLVDESGPGNLVARFGGVTTINAGYVGGLPCFEQLCEPECGFEDCEPVCSIADCFESVPKVGFTVDTKVPFEEEPDVPVCFDCGPFSFVGLPSISLAEEDGGNLSVTGVNTRTDAGSGGLSAVESGSGNLIARLTNSVFNNAGSDGRKVNAASGPDGGDFGTFGAIGVELVELDAGGMRLVSRNVETSNNSGTGVDLYEGGTGNLFADMSRTTSESNGGAGLTFEEDAGGRGTLRLSVSSLVDNGVDLCSSADVFRDFRNTIGSACSDIRR